MTRRCAGMQSSAPLGLALRTSKWRGEGADAATAADDEGGGSRAASAPFEVVSGRGHTSARPASRASSSAWIADSMIGSSAPFITWSRLYAL